MRSHRVGHDWSDLAVAADASSYFCEMGPKVSTTPSSQGDPGSGSSPSSDFTEMPYLPLLYPLSESSQPELGRGGGIGGGGWRVWGRQSFLFLHLKNWIFWESGQICPHGLSGWCWAICEQKRYWLRSRNAPLAQSPASWRCLNLQVPGKVTHARRGITQPWESQPECQHSGREKC